MSVNCFIARKSPINVNTKKESMHSAVTRCFFFCAYKKGTGAPLLTHGQTQSMHWNQEQLNVDVSWPVRITLLLAGGHERGNITSLWYQSQVAQASRSSWSVLYGALLSTGLDPRQTYHLSKPHFVIQPLSLIGWGFQILFLGCKAQTWHWVMLKSGSYHDYTRESPRRNKTSTDQNTKPSRIKYRTFYLLCLEHYDSQAGLPLSLKGHDPQKRCPTEGMSHQPQTRGPQLPSNR